MVVMFLVTVEIRVVQLMDGLHGNVCSVGAIVLELVVQRVGEFILCWLHWLDALLIYTLHVIVTNWPAGWQAS